MTTESPDARPGTAAPPGSGAAVPVMANGAFFDPRSGTTRFSVWAPRARRVQLLLGEDPGAAAGELGQEHAGYHTGTFAAPPGTRYRYLLDGEGPFADPASRSQPDGVHGPSEVVDTTPAAPVPGWRGVAQANQVICEIHVGTFTAAGTFDGVVERLDDLRYAGYSAVELMPVAAFPGRRNWGYDGVFPFAVQATYGGRPGLARLCRAAHEAQMAVICDVVYNHFGPEGAVFSHYGPYLTDRYRTPWGDAMNFAGEGSDEVRRYFVEQALSMVRELGVDGFRLDAVHAYVDHTASPFVTELCGALHAEGRRLGRVVTVVAESPDDDPRLIAAPEAGGIGCDGVWNDDFHHALRVALTGQRDRYFGDYRGAPDLARALTRGFVMDGRPVPSRGRRHGVPAGRPPGGDRLVVFAQNHDQIGNAGLGRRLADQLPIEAQFPVAAAVLCSGWVPLRFMGEEYGETAPFHYFTDHTEPALVQAVRAGRRAETGAPGGVGSPDPQDPATMEACRVRPSLAAGGVHAELLEWQRLLLALRREHPALGSLEPARSTCWFDGESAAFALVRRADPYLGGQPVAVVATLGDRPVSLDPPVLAGCRLDVLAGRGVVGAGPGGRLTPSPGADGTLRVDLAPYGVLVAAVTEPAPAHAARACGVFEAASPPWTA